LREPNQPVYSVAVKQHSSKQSSPWLQYAPFAILLLFTCGLFSRGTWLWSLSGLGYLPWAWSLAVLLLAGLLLFLVVRGRETKPLVSSPVTFDAIVVVVAAGAFLGLVTQTHFLGDGYLLLSNLAEKQPLIKQRESMVMRLLVALRNGLGPASATTALAAYRALAIGSGTLSVAATLWLSRRLVAEEPDRRLLIGLLLTGGSTLLFFGYVEHYAVWNLVLNVFALAGVLASKDRSWRWLPVGLLVIALILHPISILLVPPTLYLLLPASLQSRLQRIRRRTLVWASMVAIGGLYAWTQSLSGDWYYFKFAFLPLFTDQFTVDRYTLLSWLHLLDFANLLLVLAPGLWVLGFIARSPLTQKKDDQTFLQLYLLAAIFMAFLLDPKLGMPRDWDLFAFAGTPVILCSWFCLLQPRLKLRAVRRLVASAIVIQAVVLAGRVATSALPKSGVSQATAFFEHAPGRSRTGWNLLSLYYLQQGDSASYRTNQAQREVRYPEERLALASQRFMEQGDAVRARTTALQALRCNPRTFEAWVNLGRYFRSAGRYDSSLICMQIADGLNPYALVTLVELGMARLKVGDPEGAEQTWLYSLTIDSSHFITYGALANLYASRSDTASQVAYLQAGLTKPDPEAWAAITLAELYVARSQPEEVKKLVSLAEQRGFDSSTVGRLREILVTTGAPKP
jgi:hypothetical protein